MAELSDIAKFISVSVENFDNPFRVFVLYLNEIKLARGIRHTMICHILILVVQK